MTVLTEGRSETFSLENGASNHKSQTPICYLKQVCYVVFRPSALLTRHLSVFLDILSLGSEEGKGGKSQANSER